VFAGGAAPRFAELLDQAAGFASCIEAPKSSFRRARPMLNTRWHSRCACSVSEPVVDCANHVPGPGHLVLVSLLGHRIRHPDCAVPSSTDGHGLMSLQCALGCAYCRAFGHLKPIEQSAALVSHKGLEGGR